MLFESVFCGLLSTNLVLAACEFGQQFSDAFGDFDGGFYQVDWYLLPFAIQRMLPMIILNAQKPVVVKCFGNISCERETFKKVSWGS